MTATQTAAEQHEASVGDVVRQLRNEVRSIMFPGLDVARRLIGESGVPAAREALAKALSGLEAAQAEHREAQAEERAKADAHTAAVADAEWTLDGQIVRESNKTYLLTGVGQVAERKQVTADEAKAWKAAEARKLPEVAEAERAWRFAAEETAAARDAVTVADKRLQAARHELDAAVAQLNVLAAGLAAKAA